MRLFKWFDAVLLAASQKFCDGFQRLTGLTKFRLQKWAQISLVASTWLVVFAIGPSLLLVSLASVSSVTVAGVIWLDDEAEVVFLACGHPQLDEGTTVLQRLFAVCVCAAMPVSIFLSDTIGGLPLACFGVSYIAWMYFSACIPHPPTEESRVQECYKWARAWLDSRIAPLP